MGMYPQRFKPSHTHHKHRVVTLTLDMPLKPIIMQIRQQVLASDPIRSNMEYELLVVGLGLLLSIIGTTVLMRALVKKDEEPVDNDHTD